jgi:uncharacterized protein (TIGR00369 family)
MNDSGNEQPRDARKKLEALEAAARPTFWGFLGCELVSAGEDKAVIALQVRPEHLNLAGIVHGGVLASLLDNAMGLVAILACPGERTVTTGLNVHYLQSSSEGRLTCEAALVHRTRRTLTLEARVADNKGELLVWGSGTFRRVT